MPVDLREYRLVYIGPAEGQTAVGDYAENFVNAVQPLFGEVVQRRTLGPGAETVAQVRGHRRAVAELVAGGKPGRVLVHAELAAGAVSAFWSIAGLRGVPVTATVHDPPQGIWWPARTRFVAQHRLVMHGLHYPLRPLSRRIEGMVNGDRTMVALSQIGADSIKAIYPGTTVAAVPHIISERPRLRPLTERPKAVGFFGHVYRGKGFEQIARIRRELPDDIVIRVAGRGTEALTGGPGVEIVGPVDGPAEDAFFDSVRAVVIPYGKRHFYAETYPASGSVAHAMAYRTPVVCTDYGALAELDERAGALVVRIGDQNPEQVASSLAKAIVSLVDDDERLAEFGRHVEAYREACSGPRTAEAFGRVWTDMLARASVSV
ncbi:glycosyltransferase family 4 protein [Mycolicibacterium sp. 141076]|uniref:glycosyltransferase family 4 protein n=1 Tax=Mycobacteriaceae TaxID=1762 RepID=UPI00299D4E8A|nr:glycosyltransferase family 4 protein [Mycolicibacterium sp. 141076]MDX1880214.1 glycosyltransferase family 4 protein [Mycolicibacterium sp. 141076]